MLKKKQIVFWTKLLASLTFCLNALGLVNSSVLVTLAQPLNTEYPQLKSAGFLLGQAPTDATIVLLFRTDTHAVRVFLQSNQYYMNVYNHSTSVLTLNAVSVKQISSDEGTSYLYQGELTFIAYSYLDGRKELLIEGYGERRLEPESDRSSPDNQAIFEFQFDNDAYGWEVGFADYPVGEEEFYELTSGFEQLPSPLENRSGLKVSGNNHSDDLFMFIKKKFTGFEPNTRYQLQFEITIATNAPRGCVGVGGAPGESVTIKAGASVMEPFPLNNGSDFYLMNIDKGNQSTGGRDAISIGDFANSTDCENSQYSYELKTLNSKENEFTVLTGSDGTLWVLFATDSGFEATTSIYYLSGSIIASDFSRHLP